MRDTLHWLPISELITYRLQDLCLWHCLLGTVPAYLWEVRCLASACSGHRSLHSVVHGDLFIPFACTSTMQDRVFFIAGLTIWNDLPVELHLLPRTNSSAFCSSLKA